MRRLVSADAFFIIAEIICLLGLLASGLMNPYDVAREAVSDLIMGSGSLMFYGGFVLCGLVLPFVLDVRVMLGGDLPMGGSVVWFALVFFGGFMLRLIVVNAGAHVAVWL